MSNPTALAQKVWNYCNILRDDGLSYGDYQIQRPPRQRQCRVGASRVSADDVSRSTNLPNASRSTGFTR